MIQYYNPFLRKGRATGAVLNSIMCGGAGKTRLQIEGLLFNYRKKKGEPKKEEEEEELAMIVCGA